MAVQKQHTAVVEALILAGANVDLAEYVRTVVGKIFKKRINACHLQVECCAKQW